MRSASLLVLALVLGCKKDPPQHTAPAAPAPARPTAITDGHVAAIEAMLAAMTTLDKDLKAAGKDCPKLAAALAAHAKTVKAANTTLHEAYEKDLAATPEFGDANAWLIATYDERRTKAFRRLEVVYALCEQDPAFAAALASLELGLSLPEGTPEAFERQYQALE